VASPSSILGQTDDHEARGGRTHSQPRGIPTPLSPTRPERGVEVDHVTIYRWVQRFTPLLADAARPGRHAVGDRWQVDETYVKVAGRWRYVYRSIDQFGQVIDVFVSPRRDAAAARRFLERALGATKITPVEVITDQAATYPVGHCCI